MRTVPGTNPDRRTGNGRPPAYRHAVRWLESLVRTPPRTRSERERLGLVPIESLFDRVGNPHHGVPAIHVTGSKGKGSTALYTEALLAAAGLRTGTFTSPHLEDGPNESGSTGRRSTRPGFAEALERVRPAVTALHESDADAAPAFFDALVAAAFSVFADAPVDVAVVEAGIGARLDPTRTCRAVATCVTGIELEHTDRLGPTIADIAREKAAIARPGVPLVAGPMPEEARAVLEREAARAALRSCGWAARSGSVAASPSVQATRREPARVVIRRAFRRSPAGAGPGAAGTSRVRARSQAATARAVAWRFRCAESRAPRPASQASGKQCCYIQAPPRPRSPWPDEPSRSRSASRGGT